MNTTTFSTTTMKRSLLVIMMVTGLFGMTAVRAQFDPSSPTEPGTYLVTITSNDLAMGTVTGSGSYGDGTVVEITATPKSGCQFVKWSDENTDNPRNITITTDVTLTAIFSSSLPLSVCLSTNVLEFVNNPYPGNIVFKNSSGVEVLSVPKTGVSQTIKYPGAWPAGTYTVVLDGGNKTFTVEKK